MIVPWLTPDVFYSSSEFSFMQFDSFEWLLDA
jgi:hypothetical protein